MQQLKRRPFSVILFDEIEKAAQEGYYEYFMFIFGWHALVLTVLLQVLDDGRLTSGQSQTIDAKNAVIIMTSNLVFFFVVFVFWRIKGAEYLTNTVATPDGKTDEITKAMVMDSIRKFFKPEFLGFILSKFKDLWTNWFKTHYSSNV